MAVRNHQLPTPGQTLVDAKREEIVTYVGPAPDAPGVGDFSRVVTNGHGVKLQNNRSLFDLREFNAKALDGRFGEDVRRYAVQGEGLTYDETYREPNAFLMARYIVDSVAIDVEASFEYRENPAGV